MFFKAIYPSPLGEIALVCDEDALVSLSLPGQKGFAQEAEYGEHPILTRAKAWLDDYFAGNAPCPAARTYTLQRDETLESTALRLNTSLAALLRANPCLAPSEFTAGRCIYIPQ